jgi:Domain of unknown function (DUF397)
MSDYGWRKSSRSNPSGNCVEVQVITSRFGDGLGPLRVACPGWTFWRGEHTRSLWAMPPAGGPLIDAETVVELARAVDGARELRSR